MNTHDQHPDEFLSELALGVLPEAEALAVRRHLAGCGRCAAEFAELEQVAALLPLAADAPGPSPATRAALLRAIEREASRRGRFPVPVWAWQAAAGLLLLALGAAAGWGLGRADRSPAPPDTAPEALLAAAARGETLRASAASSLGVEGGVLLAPGLGLAYAHVEGLPSPPAGRVYQAWLIEGETPLPAGFLSPAGSLLLAPGASLGAFTAFAVTLEAEGGAPAPTTDPLIVVPFALAARR
ncbi:MAG: hypothetical protein KatS3mg062_1154 [Tepidiforma sp.]|nr:MAG: hypothetical protein KatS3mg062_1154 [Tepidiforma sp.]